MLTVLPIDSRGLERFETRPGFVESLNASRYIVGPWVKPGSGTPAPVTGFGSPASARHGHKSFKIEGFEESFLLGKGRYRDDKAMTFESNTFLNCFSAESGGVSGTNNLDCIRELWGLVCQAYSTGSLVSVKGVIEVHTEKPSEEAVRAAMARAAAGHTVTIPAAKVTRDLVVTDITISRPKRGAGGGSGDKGGGGGAASASDADPW